MKEKRLTVKQQRFVDTYIKTGNAAEAARQAGYKKTTADAIGRENLRKPTVRKAINARLKEIENAQIADAKEVMRHLTSAMRGEIEEEVIVCEGIGDGLSAARIMKKHISAHDRLRAAEALMKRYGLSLSDVETEEKKAKIEALRKEMDEGACGEEVTIIDDTGTDSIE